MDYESEYNSARSRYYNACTEINNCQNRLSSLQSQKQAKVNRINELVSTIKDHETAYEQMTIIVNGEDDLNSKFLDISTKISAAADNYAVMILSSDVTNKNLIESNSEEMSQTKLTLESIISRLNTAKSTLITKITDFKNQLRTAENDLEEIKRSISSTQSSLSDWQRIKSNASYDMEYYRRKMQEQEQEVVYV